MDETVRGEVVDMLGAARTAEAVSELDTDDAVAVIEELEQRIPLPAGKAAAGFDVLVGFLLSAEQLNLNRATVR